MITLTTGQEEDWAKNQRLIELRVEERFGPRPHKALYFREDTSDEILSAIEAENVKASRQ